MTRKEAIQIIMEHVINEVIIASNGMISREVYQIKDRPLNFYMLGSMGAALGIGLGIAYSRPDLKIVVISGDGSALMSLGTIILHKKLGLQNLYHFILDNNCHASTGGQLTCSDCVDFERLAPNTYSVKVSNEIGDAPRVPLTPKEITERFKNAVILQQKQQEKSG